MKLLSIVGMTGVLATAALAQTAPGPSADEAVLEHGANLFFDRCIQCHDGGDDRAPGPEALGGVSHEAVIASMTTGPMTPMAAGWNAQDLAAVAAYIATFR